jgi:lipoprotein-releasing system permease protein
VNFPLFLSLKYIRPKRSVASVVTLVSILGVMLGVAVVVIVRSVMTGFGDQWRQKILEFKPHVSIVADAGRLITDEDDYAAAIRKIPGVTCATPEVDSRILLSFDGRVRAPVLIGIGGGDFAKSYDVGAPVAGTFDLEPDSIVIGLELARSLGVWVGSAVTVCAPPLPDEVYLPRKWRVSGIFSSGHYDYDTGYAIANLDSARDLAGIEEGVLAIHVKTDCPTDGAKFPALVKSIPVPGRYRVLTWREADRQLFDALAVETNMTAVLLLLISVVALFCVMNTLLVLTVQKTPEIGLLKALGFGKLKIMGVFLAHGLIQCTIGVALGLLASWAVLSNLQRIVEWLAKMGMEVFPPAIYNLEEIPHRIVPSDVVYVVVLIYVFGLMASLVPALLAAAKDPVKALDDQ